jgi:hypothetical protein
MSRKAWIATAVALFAVTGALIVGQGSSLIANVLLHDNPNGGGEISSNEAHIESLEVGAERVMQQPLGGGIGSTGSASLYGDAPLIIENQYLFIAHEAGWIGLLVFIVIYIGILARLWKQRKDWLSLGLFASGIGIGLIGLLLPVWADDTVSIVWWGLAGLALGGTYARKKTK